MALSLAPASLVEAPQPYKVNTWFFMCGPLSLTLFLYGLAWNVKIFKRHELAFDKVMDMRKDEIPSSKGVAQFATALLAIQMALFGVEFWRRGDKFGVDEVQMEIVLVIYCFFASVLLLWPFDVMHRKARYFMLRKLAKCLWPFQHFSLDLPPHATPFIEVFLADGLTSLSKFIQDACVAWMLLSLSFTQEMDTLKLSYVTKMKSSPLPYVAASMPYMIRATQCLISFQRTASANDRFLHLLNTLKYCSSLLVICVGAYPQVMGYTNVRLDTNSFFLFCAVFNSLYSFLWDVIMDWGLGQPNLPSKVKFLRHQLLYRPRNLYYVVILVDFLLRILWATKWWDWENYGLNFKMLSMVAEVARRIIWNVLRVEWQCLKLEILGCKKLSEDSMELEQSMENMPLMTEGEEDSDEDGDEDTTCGGGHTKIEMVKQSVATKTKTKTIAHEGKPGLLPPASLALPVKVSLSLSPPRSLTHSKKRTGGSPLTGQPLEEIILSPAPSGEDSSTTTTGSSIASRTSISTSVTTTLHRKPHASFDDQDESFTVAGSPQA